MFLDALCYSLLLMPFAFFWCCCTEVCIACPDGVQLNCSVTIPDITGVDPVFCDECDDISDIMFTAIYIPTTPTGSCQWTVTTEYGEGLCIEPQDFGDVIIGLIKYRATVYLDGTAGTFGDSFLTLALQAIESPSDSNGGTVRWSKAMPGHSGTPSTGPCPAQTISFDFGDLDVSDGGNLTATCDFSACEPEITFF